jgi:hypothetical protein
MANEPQKAQPPDPWAVLAGIQQALTLLAQRPAESQDPDMMAKLTGAMERIASATTEAAEKTVLESKRAFRPSNEVSPNRSVFHPRGRALTPDLKCRMAVPWPVSGDTETREEVQLLNLLEQGEYRVRRPDGSAYVERVTAKTDLNGKLSDLNITNETAFNNDNYKTAPGLVDRLRQMLKQHPKPIREQAAAVLSMDEEQALIDSHELSVTA